ncbi:hypothetical protein TELCIR_08863, partial [Teladorsagia circumcincta]
MHAIHKIDGPFKQKCDTVGNNMYQNRIIACLTPQNDEVEVGSKKEIDGWNYECIMKASGIISLKSRPSEKRTCSNGSKYGEEFITGNVFKLRCGAYGKQEFVGCVVDGILHKEGEIFK